MKVASQDEIRKAYREGAAVAPRRYSEAVANTSGVIEAAKAAGPLWEAKVQEAIANKSFEKGFDGVSDEDWRKGALGVGAQRIGPGMTANVDKQVSEFEPYRSALAATTLPPRTADGMTNLTQRAGTVVQVMMNTKKAQG